MANVTAKQLSEVIGVSVDKLLDQLKNADVKVKDENDPISDEDKLKLLESLRSSHGKEENDGPRKITLQRKSKSELRVAGNSGRNITTKTQETHLCAPCRSGCRGRKDPATGRGCD